MIIHPGICANCRVAIYGKPNGKGGWIFKHKPSTINTPCDNPERRLPPPCTCKTMHQWCYIKCDCEQHSYYINYGGY